MAHRNFMKRFASISLLAFLIIQIPALGGSLLKKYRIFISSAGAKAVLADSLPLVFTENRGDFINSKLRHEAVLQFAIHQLPKDAREWKKQRIILKDQIVKKAGIVINHNLPLHYEETGVKKMEGFTVKNVIFQTRPGMYATANLYIPDGKGPFPAVVNMHGHWAKGRVHEVPQSRGPSLALNGYVCLSVDAFGSGERTTTHGVDEYHGANLGASLMNIGESLLGIQVSDNMRAVDLLVSLPFVDPDNIGATGASGGGNQTMWLSAIDERIKACMPVVSVGTFESVVMRSNCICELLIDGLTFTEASGVLALIAPRAIKMCNHEQDSNPTFFPAEMLRTYANAKPVFEMLGAEKNISYQRFDLKHGYWPENREAMLGWFDLHLKGTGTGAPKKEVAFKILPEEQLMVYARGRREPKIETIAEYCRRRGGELRSEFLSRKSFDPNQKKKELGAILRIKEEPQLETVYRFGALNEWDRIALKASDDKLIPLLHRRSSTASGEYVIICNPLGKAAIPPALIDQAIRKGAGVVLVDLSGTGEAASSGAAPSDRIAQLHTQSRAELWLGRSVLGEWTKELNLVTEFLTNEYKAKKITIDGSKGTGLAGLFLSALEGDIDEVILRNAPISYLFDAREGVDYFSMGVHVPGFLAWGDVSLAAALTGKKITFIDPVTMSGKTLSKEDLQAFNKEFDKIRASCRKSGETVFSHAPIN
jgi:hypothetical protein